jgi:hypothetical protein
MLCPADVFLLPFLVFHIFSLETCIKAAFHSGLDLVTKLGSMHNNRQKIVDLK